ncbi:MAG: hypothetical protein SWC96_00800 [Thermodesulfobacteriota bacterium]|nr:hypothetical protein [Thermodesulfobacteriota bacterium]
MTNKQQPTLENDLVLIHFEDVPMVFARVETIVADHKKEWYQVKLLILAVPLQVVTWILKEKYINGGEFTMEGKRVRMERVVCPEDPLPATTAPPTPSGKSPSKRKSTGQPGQVISFPKKILK